MEVGVGVGLVFILGGERVVDIWGLFGCGLWAKFRWDPIEGRVFNGKKKYLINQMSKIKKLEEAKFLLGTHVPSCPMWA